MKKKILSLLIAGMMLLGNWVTAACVAAPHSNHSDRPAQHRWFNFWHRDKDTKSIKRKQHPSKKHKIKKKDSDRKWFHWNKNKHKVHKKHQNKKHIIKKKQKQQKNFHKNKRTNYRHHKH